MLAAVLRQIPSDSLEVTDAEVVATGPGQVKLSMRASGVCHTDISAMRGIMPSGTPAVLGHEGAGEVVEVGEGVPGLQVGDHVIVAWVPPCGTCHFCIGGQAQLCSTIMLASSAEARFIVGGEPAFGFAGTGTFAEEMVLPWQACIKIPNDVPFDVASLIGCGVMTGVGAAINTAKVRPGSSVAVIGCGGVGISVIQGARIAGAAELVAVDVVESKREEAKRFGATHACGPEGLDDLKAELTGGEGFDYSFEVVGIPTTIRGAYDAVRRGGVATIVGAGAVGQTLALNAIEVL